MRKIHLAEDTITNDEVDRLRDWLGTYPRLTKGEVTERFEAAWSAWLGVRHSTFVNSGSSAILVALSALIADGRIKRGDKVVVPAVSWLTDVSSPMNLGLEVVLCDANLQDLSLDLSQLEEILEAERPAAVIAVSVLGLPPDMERLCALCRRHGAALIEDACESLGTTYKGRKLGSFGDVSVFSTYFGHHVSTIEGGLVCTNDTRLHLKVNALRSHGWTRDWPAVDREQLHAQHGIGEFEAAYTFFYPGYNVRSTDLQAFIGLSQVEKIDAVANARHVNFVRYNALLCRRNQLRMNYLRFSNGGDVVSNFAYPMVFDAPVRRAEVVRALRREGIECRPLIAGSMAMQPFMEGVKHRWSLPNAAIMHSNGMYLPNHHSLVPDEVNRVCDLVESAAYPFQRQPMGPTGTMGCCSGPVGATSSAVVRTPTRFVSPGVYRTEQD